MRTDSKSPERCKRGTTTLPSPLHSIPFIWFHTVTSSGRFCLQRIGFCDGIQVALFCAVCRWTFQMNRLKLVKTKTPVAPLTCLKTVMSLARVWFSTAETTPSSAFCCGTHSTRWPLPERLVFLRESVQIRRNTSLQITMLIRFCYLSTAAGAWTHFHFCSWMRASLSSTYDARVTTLVPHQNHQAFLQFKNRTPAMHVLALFFSLYSAHDLHSLCCCICLTDFGWIFPIAIFSAISVDLSNA